MDALKTLFFIGILFFSVLGAQVALGADQGQKIKVNRYTLSGVEPTEAQLDLMSVVIDLEFSPEVETVGEAIIHLLSVHGFKLGEIVAGGYSQYVLYLSPLPEVHRQLGPLKLETALRVLGGMGFELDVNLVTREVNYRLHEAYDTLLSTNTAAKAKKNWDKRFGINTEDGPNLKPYDDSQSKQNLNHYGPVVEGDYLSQIAFSIKPQKASVEQTMMSIFELNPSAFSEDNINILSLGAVLELPDDNAILAMSAIDAKVRVREHYMHWLRSKKTPARNL